MNPFETLSALVNQLLSDFNDQQTTITINGHMISTSSFDQTSHKNKQNKSTFTIPNMTDQLIHHIHNFRFTIAFFLKQSSYAYEWWSAAKKIIKRNRIAIESFGTFILNLPAKILTFLHNCFQAFLKSCAEANEFNNIK